MKVVILDESSIENNDLKYPQKPTPLNNLLGLTLIERIMLSLSKSGIRDFIVISDKWKAQIAEALKGEKYKYLNVDFIESNTHINEDFYSTFLKVQDMVNNLFLLILTNRLFEPELINELLSYKLEKNDAVLLGDLNPDNFSTKEEAVKVKIEKGRVIEAGKELKDYDAFDCGIYLFRKNVFNILEEEKSKGIKTITDLVNSVALKGKLAFNDTKGRFCISINSERDLKIAEKRLLKSLVKPTDGFISRYINRPISTRISSKLVNYRNIKPDNVSLAGFLICIISAFFFAFGDYLTTLIGGILAQLSSVLDGCDGEIARLRYENSKYGEWFDSVLDRFADSALIFGILLGLRGYHTGIDLWIYGYLALTGSLMMSYTAVKYDTWILQKKERHFRFGRDTRMFMIMTGAIFNVMYYLIIVLAVMTNLTSIRRLYLLKRLGKEGISWQNPEE